MEGRTSERAGSESRRPLGMAEVAVTIDNGDETLRLDYSEVVVSRRLFRTGESEYLINRATSRLKDIRDYAPQAVTSQVRARTRDGGMVWLTVEIAMAGLKSVGEKYLVKMEKLHIGVPAGAQQQ